MRKVISKCNEDLRQIKDTIPQKIYAFYHSNLNTVYKLQGMNGGYAFCNLENSATDWESHYDFKVLIERVGKRFMVYEFDTLKEFAEWLVKECKCHS